MSSDICYIKQVNCAKSCVPPILVNFDHGSLSKEEAEEVDCDVYVKENDCQNPVAIVSRRNNYFTGTPDSDALCQTMLLIKNKHKNKARLISLPTCILSKPLLKRSALSNVSSPEKTVESRSSDVIALTRTFGSKRSKRQSELGLRIDLNVTDNSTELLQTVSNISISKKDLKDTTEDVDKMIELLPPCNRDATKVDDVYKLDDILNEMERKMLESKATLMVDNPPTPSDEKNSEFLYKMVTCLSDQLTVERMEILVYADLLLKFLKTTARELKTKKCSSMICPFSNIIGKKILKEFTLESDGGIIRPTSSKDKVVCYIIVLILLACDYKVDFDILSACLKGVGQKKLKQLMRTVGAVQSFPSSKYVLKVPLPSLPTAPVKRKGKM